MKSYSIGRDNACDIVLNDHTDVISRRHAVLTVSSSGKMTITDQSTNGTYINGQKISSNVPVPVTRKDSVSFAHVSALDWNMIPKSNKWVTYLLIGLAVALIAALAVVYLTHEKPKPIQDDPPVATDTINNNDEKEPTTYTVTFDPNEGQGVMEPQQVPIGLKTGLIGNAFTREGYDFTGWNTQADGKGTSYEDKATVTLSDNITLYAQWKQRTHQVTFEPNAKGVKGKMDPQEVVEGKDVELSANLFTRDGYTFVGWNTKPNGKGENYSDKAVVNLKEDLKLYAKWIKKTKVKGSDEKGNDDEKNDNGKGTFIGA